MVTGSVVPRLPADVIGMCVPDAVLPLVVTACVEVLTGCFVVVGCVLRLPGDVLLASVGKAVVTLVGERWVVRFFVVSRLLTDVLRTNVVAGGFVVAEFHVVSWLRRGVLGAIVDAGCVDVSIVVAWLFVDN